MISIVESNMTFGPYPAENIFELEKNAPQKSLQHVALAEFYLLKPEKGCIYIIEAKSSSPRSTPDQQNRFDEYIAEITAKLSNSLQLYFSTLLQRQTAFTEPLPAAFKALSLAETKFRLFLVINGHRLDWLPPLQEALQKALLPIVKIWNLSPLAVQVLNHELALEHQLISTYLAKQQS